jgi:hypothetical protein
MQRALLSLALLFGVTVGASAQDPKSIDPGMTQAQVAERLGAPAATRTSGNFTYMFYKNACVKACGMDDVVILESDGVIDAMFRSAARQYTGVSSSPQALPAAQARTKAGSEGAANIVIPADSPEAVVRQDSTAAAGAEAARSTLRIKTGSGKAGTAASETAPAEQQGAPKKAARSDTTTRRP